MKKLQNKVFFTIFIILTIFSVLILVITNINNYNNYYREISSVLNSNDNLAFGQNRNIFLNYDIYTVMLDSNSEDGYKDIISHKIDDETQDNIKSVASDIISNHKYNSYIGNLYSSDYSYAFTKYNTLIIVDNNTVQSKLSSLLLNSIFTFITFEFSVFLIAYYLTRWIITPVKQTFERQKRFIADASHELKTPLAVIIASADAYDNDKDEKWIKNIKTESENMSSLVKNLLDLETLENDKDIPKKEENISNLIESEILTFESLFYENNIKLEYNIDKDIKYLSNDTQIKELMQILLDNAIKHSLKKGKVIINLNKIKGDIILTVSNKGTPIAKEDEEKIFERFYKVDKSRNRENSSYGLGLAIAKGIVLNHNGSIIAYSKDGYNTFKVTFNN